MVTKKRVNFIPECIEEPTSLEEKLTKTEFFIFGTEGRKCKFKGNSNRIASFTMIRDLFGSIRCLLLQHKKEVAWILSYPQILFPCLCVTLVAALKGNLTKELESIIKS